jgi:cytochrome bd ubiquinol oxidase subunit II
MDILTLENYIVLAATLSLYILELGAALFLLTGYDKYRQKLSAYVAPIWEITGTFTVFYIVSFEAVYPGLLTAVGTLYILPAILILIFIIMRDAFLAYSEYVKDKTSELRYSRVYVISTIIALFLVVTVLDSSISGAGVNIATLSANYAYMVLNPFNILMFMSILALVIACSAIFFGIRNLKLIISSFIIFFVLLLVSLYSYVNYIYLNLLTNLFALIPAALILLLIFAFYIKKSKYTRFLIMPFLFTSILTFEFLEYPFILGGTVSLNSYLTNSASAYYLGIITIVGGAFLIISLAYFVYVQHLHRKKKGPLKR